MKQSMDILIVEPGKLPVPPPCLTTRWKLWRQR